MEPRQSGQLMADLLVCSVFYLLLRASRESLIVVAELLHKKLQCFTCNPATFFNTSSTRFRDNRDTLHFSDAPNLQDSHVQLL